MTIAEEVRRQVQAALDESLLRGSVRGTCIGAEFLRRSGMASG